MQTTRGNLGAGDCGSEHVFNAVEIGLDAGFKFQPPSITLLCAEADALGENGARRVMKIRIQLRLPTPTRA